MGFIHLCFQLTNNFTLMYFSGDTLNITIYFGQIKILYHTVIIAIQNQLEQSSHTD